MEVCHTWIASQLREHRILVRAGKMPLFHGVALGSDQSGMWRTGLWGNVVWRRLRLHPWGRAGVGGLGLWPRRRNRLGRPHLIGERWDLLARKVRGLSLTREHVLLGAHGVGLSGGPHLLLKEALLIGLQASSGLRPQGRGELAQLAPAPLLQVLQVLWHPGRRRRRLGGRVAQALGWLKLAVAGQPRPDSRPRSLLLLLHHLLPPQKVPELRRHGAGVHAHLRSLGAHPPHGRRELLLWCLLLRQAGPLDARLHGIQVRHGGAGVDPLLARHGGGLQPWLALGHAGLPGEGLRIGGGVLGSPLLDERSQQLGVGVKDTEHLLLLQGGAGRPESPQKVL